MTTAERPVYLGELSKRYPGSRGADHLNPATLVRWITTGAKGIDGQRHRLPAVRLGSRWAVRPGDLEAFITALSAMPDEPAPTVTPTQDRKRAEAANAEFGRLLSK